MESILEMKSQFSNFFFYDDLNFEMATFGLFL